MVRLLLLLVTIIVFAAPVLGQAPDNIRKLDHTAQALVRAVTEGRALQAAERHGVVADVRVSPSGDIRVGVFVRLQAGASVAALEGAGMAVQTLAGNIAVGFVSVEYLPALARLADVEAVEVAHLLEAVNDLAGEAINLPPVHAGTGLPQPYRGQGVVVGVVDTGIDFTHPDFSDAHGTRIEYLLELLPDDDNQPPTAQAEWTKAQIDDDAAAVTQRDIHGHGTHVTGSAAGGGIANPAFVGAAPESRIVFVKGARTGSVPGRPHVFSEVDMVNSVAYIFDRAEDLQMPAVVNLSLGRPGGPLDGRASGQIAIDNLTGEGRIVVFAAGNDGSRVIHWGTDLTAEQEALMAVHPGSFTTGALGQFVQVTTWYDPGSVSEVTLTARDPASAAELGSLTVAAGESHSEPIPIEGPDGVVGFGFIDATVTNHPANALGLFYVVMTNMNQEGVDLADVLWTITVTAAEEGRIDAWIQPSMGAFRVELPVEIPEFIPGDTYRTLNHWAAAHQVIAAGSFTTRNEWVNADGETIIAYFQGEPYELGRRTHFSARGPTRDGRVRPDILAPGAFIGSALSSHAGSYGGSLYGEPHYVVGQGTSFAAPFASGVAALLLQVEPSLTPHDVRWLLRNSAVQEAEMGPLPNPSYGFGKLDAFAAVQEALTNIATGPPIAHTGELVLKVPFPNPARTSSTVAFNLPSDARAHITLYDVLGRRAAVLTDEYLPAGPHRMALERGSLASGMYLIVLRAGDQRQAQRLVLLD